MSASYLPFNEPQVPEAAHRSVKVQVIAGLLLGFGLGCGAMYVAGGQSVQVLTTPINMAVTPGQASRSMRTAMLPYAGRQAGFRPLSAATSPNEHDEPAAIPAQQGRREMMTGLGFAAAGALLKERAANAAFGDAANVFGQVTNPTGFQAYAGDGFSLLIPAKWQPSKETEFPNVVFRYEDSFDQVNSAVVIMEKGGSLQGSPDAWLNKYSYLLGGQSYAGQTRSEGGFAPNRVSAASVLDVKETTDKKNRKVYNFEILTRTADGNEGGRHQFFKALESNGVLYVLKVQLGDKRYIRGQKNEGNGMLDSFNVA